jgi:UDP-N-acetyl-D-glucosamine dehydrogenase
VEILEKIKNRSAKVGVIGLGYVGLPLAVLQAKTGFQVFGVDEVGAKVEMINRGHNYISDVVESELREVVNQKKLEATTDFSVLRQCDIILICVPTPLTRNKEPDISAIVNVLKHLSNFSHPHMLVVLESTTYPGTTEEVILPALTAKGLTVGKDLFVAFSPERVDPGNTNFKTHNTFKLVGGVTEECREVAKSFYEQSIVKIFPLSSPRVAEMAKVFENVFRSVNIALVNELTLLCDRMNINVYEVIDAAATKNFGFMAFYPGPGVGGHCIPLDPYYLSWKSKEYDVHTRFIELAGEINENMPYFVLNKLQRVLNQRGKCLKGSTVFVLGVTYKADIEDPRESPATKVMELLLKEGADLQYSDPFTPLLALQGQEFKSQQINTETLQRSACALILTAHSAFDYQFIVENAPVVFDTRNGTRNVKHHRDRIVLLST